jgi:hypothetical protein
MMYQVLPVKYDTDILYGFWMEILSSDIVAKKSEYVWCFGVDSHLMKKN